MARAKSSADETTFTRLRVSRAVVYAKRDNRDRGGSRSIHRADALSRRNRLEIHCAIKPHARTIKLVALRLP